MNENALLEEQGVRQGGILSPSLYKMFINPLLGWYEKKHLGLQIGSIHIGSPACADDIILLSDNVQSLQIMLNLQGHFANCERYFISETKTKVMTFTSKRNKVSVDEFYLNDEKLEEVSEYTHIGINRNHDSKELVRNRIQVARRTSYALMGAGLHGYNGTNPEVILKLWNTYVRPRLLFGLDSVVLTNKDMYELNMFQKSQLKTLLNLPERTTDAAVYILSGQFPIESFIHYLILVNLGNILRQDNIEKSIAIRQLIIKGPNSSSWFIYAAKLLELYDLDSVFDLIENMPSKFVWKNNIKMKINLFWSKRLEEMAVGKSTMKFLSCKSMKVGNVHPIWSSAGYDPISIQKANVKSRLLSGVYILQSNRSKFNQHQISPLCQLCEKSDEDIEHFLLDCKATDHVRSPYIDSLRSFIRSIDIALENVIFHNQQKMYLMQILMDISHPSLPIILQSDISMKIEAVSRCLVYAIHRERCRQLKLTF